MTHIVGERAPRGVRVEAYLATAEMQWTPFAHGLNPSSCSARCDFEAVVRDARREVLRADALVASDTDVSSRSTLL